MKTKLLFFTVILLALVITSCAGKGEVVSDQIIPGADRTEIYLPMLGGKNVALAINNSSVVGKTPLLDALVSLGVNVVKVFSPEHGFRGGNNYDTIDVKTGIEIKSLYGSGKYKPLPNDLANVDVMIFDPSPNLNTQQSILLYPSLCLFEGTDISQGRGTMFPFQVLGNPLLAEFYEFSFTPVSIDGMSTRPPHMDKECFGLDLRDYDTNIFKESGRINLSWLIEFYNIYPDKDKFFRAAGFDLLAGGDMLRKQITEGLSPEQIRASWEPALSNYKEMCKKYLLYQ